MEKYVQRASQRGDRDHGWLHARFSFSFADYYNPQRTGFGKLIVLNDDTIAPNSGFPNHAHDNMEIITIPTYGELTHTDSLGIKETIVPGQIQVMSAGSGIVHSEYNHSSDSVRLFQLWIETAQRNVDPRHDTKTLDLKINELNKIVSGDKKEDTIFIHQDASIFLGDFDTEKTVTFQTMEERGTFIMIVEGSATIQGELLNKRDSIEITNENSINIETNEGTKLLVVDVPMK